MTCRTEPRFFAAVLFPALLAAGAIPAAAAAPTPLMISYAQKTPDFLALSIAKDAGYFKQNGLDVTVSYLPAQEGIPALITSQEQFAAIGGTDASSAIAQGAKLKLLLTLTPKYIFQFWAQPKYASASALKGQRVAITSTTGSLFSATLLSLQQLGLTTSDVKLTPLGGVVNVNSSLLAGSVAAAASHPPATYQFQKAGLVDLVDLAKKELPSVSAGLWVTQSYLDAHRDVVQNVVNAIVEAVHREKTDRAYTESAMTKFLGVKDKGELDFTYDFYANEVLAPEPMPEVAQFQSDIDSLSLNNPKVKTVNAAAAIDQSFVKNAVKQRGGAGDGTASNSKTPSH